MSSVWNEQPQCSKALHVSGHIPFTSKYIFKYTHNLNPLRKKSITKLRISDNQSSENLSFPNPLSSVSSPALTIPLTTQTHLHLPSCSPILCFPSFLSHSSTCFSIHPWLPSTQLWKTNSCPKTNFSSINQRLFSHPYTSLTGSDFTKHWNFFQRRAFSLGKGLAQALRAVGPRDFSDPGLKFNPEKAAMASCPLPWGTGSCTSGRRTPHVLTLRREQNRLLLILAGRPPSSDNPSAELSRHSGERDEKKG